MKGNVKSILLITYENGQSTNWHATAQMESCARLKKRGSSVYSNMNVDSPNAKGEPVEHCQKVIGFVERNKGLKIKQR